MFVIVFFGYFKGRGGPEISSRICANSCYEYMLGWRTYR